MADAETPATAKKKKSFMSTLIEWIVATLIAAGAGVALAAMAPPPAPEKIATDKATPGKLMTEKKEGEKTVAACTPGGPDIIDLPPIVTNISNPADTWVRLEASITFDAKAVPHPDLLAAQIATDELAFLRTVSVTDLQGPIGLENIRQDLRDRALVRSGGKVDELLIKTLVLQ